MAAVTVNYSNVGFGEVALDGFAGASDDDKLAAAMSYAAAQTHSPYIALAGRDHKFRRSVDLYDCFRLKGCNAERSSYDNSVCTVHPNVGDGNWLNVPAADVRNVQIDDIFFYNDDQKTVWMNGPGSIHYSGLRRCSFAEFRSILGAPENHLAVTEMSCTGNMSFSHHQSAAICIGGSDSIAMWPDGVGVFTLEPNGNTPQVSFSNIGNTTFGPTYMTAPSGVGGFWIKHGQSVTVHGGVMEGLKTTRPSDGSLLRIFDRSTVNVRDVNIGNGMMNPSATAYGAKGLVEVSGKSEASFFGVQFYLAQGQSADTPVISVTGGSTAYIYGILRTDYFTPWNGRKPVVVRDASSTVIADASVEVRQV